MKSTEAEESDDSSEKWLRGANVFSVSAGHISLRARKCSDILLALGVLSPLSLLATRSGTRPWTGSWAGAGRYSGGNTDLVTLQPAQYHTTNNTPLHHKI